MRIAIISDIHGNQVALEAVLQDLAQQPTVDQLVIAGDLCLNGPRPREVVEILRNLRCPIIQGNVDLEVATQAPKKSAKKRDTVAWTREQIGEEGIAFLASLPFSYLVSNPDGLDLLVVHANPCNQETAIFPTSSDKDLDRLLGDLPASIGALAFGHYHVAYIRKWRRFLLVDVGSCGLPRDQDTRAAYAILSWQNDTWHAEERRVSYDINAVIQQLRESGIPHVEKRIKILTSARY